jgi:serine/threonine protein kinase
MQDSAIFPMLQSNEAEIPINLNSSTPHIISKLITKCLNRDICLRPTFSELQSKLEDIQLDKVAEEPTLKILSNLANKSKQFEDEIDQLKHMIKEIQIKNEQEKEKAIQATNHFRVLLDSRLCFFSSNSNKTVSGFLTGEKYVSRGSANGKDIYEGLRGGRFYLTASGNKRYI